MGFRSSSRTGESIRVSKSPYLRFESVRPKDAQATLAQTVEATVLREARLVAPLAEVTTERLCGSRLGRPGVEVALFVLGIASIARCKSSDIGKETSMPFLLCMNSNRPLRICSGPRRVVSPRRADVSRANSMTRRGTVPYG